MKKRILIVDDEPNILDGLRRLLRPMHQEWSTAYVDSGAQALAILDREPFDVVVSDMRMPGMSGAQLLEQVRERYPHMVRIILTGQSDEESGLRALRVAHQMLYKPCDADSLKATVARTCSLGDLLGDPTLQTIVTRQGAIPSLPALHQEVLAELDQPMPALDKVAAAIGKDMGMAAKLLHVVNSSFFGLKREVTSPGQAVSLLGVETMKALVLSVGIFAIFKRSTCPDLSLDELQKHSQVTGALARSIARAECDDPRLSEQAALAGLLHDVGKLILLDSAPDAYSDILRQASQSEKPLWDIEREVFGASHAEVGACLLRLWGLPLPIVEAVAWHHRPGECHGETFSPLTAVHVANAFAFAARDTSEPKIDMGYLARLRLADRLPKWRGLSLCY